MCPGAEAGISNFLRGDKTSFYDQLSFLLGFKGGEGGAGGNFKRCSFDNSSKPLLFYVSFLAIKTSSHLYRLLKYFLFDTPAEQYHTLKHLVMTTLRPKGSFASSHKLLALLQSNFSNLP